MIKDSPAARRALIIVGAIGIIVAVILALWPRVAGGWGL